MTRISPPRPFSAASARKLRTSGRRRRQTRRGRPPSPRVELRVREKRRELGRLDSARRSSRDRAGRRRLALLLRGLEEGPRVHALRDGHRVSSGRAPAPRSRARRSPRRRAGAGRRCRAPCRRRAAVASTVRSATSLRIWSSARAVSASICLRVSSIRRCARPRPPPWHGRAGRRRPSGPRRGSPPTRSLACARSARFCSSRSRASSRALSASSTACRIWSRRSSIVFWIGPKANFLRTKNVSPNATSVQIIRPGTTLIRSFEDRLRGGSASTRPGRRRGARR